MPVAGEAVAFVEDVVNGGSAAVDGVVVGGDALVGTVSGHGREREKRTHADEPL